MIDGQHNSLSLHEPSIWITYRHQISCICQANFESINLLTSLQLSKRVRWKKRPSKSTQTTLRTSILIRIERQPLLLLLLRPPAPQLSRRLHRRAGANKKADPRNLPGKKCPMSTGGYSATSPLADYDNEMHSLTINLFSASSNERSY